MKAEVLAPLVGVAVVALLAAAYFAAPALGVPLEPNKVLAIAAIVSAGASLTALVLIATRKPVYPHIGRPSEVSPLNEFPVKPFIAAFRDADMPTVTITATPGDTASELLSRNSSAMKEAEANGKRVVLVIRAGRKTFNPLEIKNLFAKLAELPSFYHILLMSDRDEFIGYIPVEGCKKDFMGEMAETKITKLVVDVLADPKKSEALRAMKGAAIDDVVEETADIRDAARKMWVNDKVQTLVVCKKAKPAGVLDKQSVLTLTSTGA
ncbi:MAG TPA: hypothetical protein VHL34_08940 [Rhizomicrobium sp.]|jgi:hypothetical protein|nr:hypothetical protein [Rhizomicrobium sp.]